MTKPVVGVIGNAYLLHERFNVQLTGEKNLRALAEVADAIPVMFAGAPDIADADALLGVVDGVLLTGARANVHPSYFDTEPDVAYEPYDEARDALALTLIKLCVARNVPRLRCLPGLSGNERRVWRVTASGDPGYTGTDEPSNAENGNRRSSSGPYRGVRGSP